MNQPHPRFLAPRICLAALFLCGPARLSLAAEEDFPAFRIYGSCSTLSASICDDYTGSIFSTPGLASTQCEMNDDHDSTIIHHYTPNPCPAENRIGSCTQNPGKTSEMISRLYSDGQFPFTMAKARRWCRRMGGEFRPD